MQLFKFTSTSSDASGAEGRASRDYYDRPATTSV